MDWGLQSKTHSLSRTIIQTEVLNLFRRVQEKNNEVEQMFDAISWFNGFKIRVQLHKMKITLEADSANEDAASKYPDIKKNNRRWWIH